MRQKKAEKSNASKRQLLELYPKVKAFPKPFNSSPAGKDAPAAQSGNLPSFFQEERPYPVGFPDAAVSAVKPAPDAFIDPERIDLQDTMLTDESFADYSQQHHPSGENTSGKTAVPAPAANEPEEKCSEPEEPEAFGTLPEYEESGEPEDGWIPAYMNMESENPGSDEDGDDEPDSFYVPDPEYDAGPEPLFGSVLDTSGESGLFSGPDDPEDDPNSLYTCEPDDEEEEALSFDSGDDPESGEESGRESASAPEGDLQLFPKLEAKGKSALVASWQGVNGADGYDLYFAPAGESFGGVFRTVPSGETSCTFSQLEKKTVYKFRVSAFAQSSGRKTAVCESETVRCITGGSTGKYTNALEIRIKDARLDLSVGEKKKIGAVATGQDPGRQVLERGSSLRYLSGNPSVATVSKEGKVKGIAPGSCRIFLFTLNGIRSFVDVTVRESPAAVAFRKKKCSMKVGKTINLKKKLVSKPDKEDGSLNWKSSDKEIAEVSRKGIVTALKKGRITVRVKSGAGGHAKIRIRVGAAKKPNAVPWESFGSVKKARSGKK